MANIPEIQIYYYTYHLIANINTVVGKIRRLAINGVVYAARIS